MACPRCFAISISTPSSRRLHHEDEPSEPQGTLVKDFGDGASLREDENGILRFDFGE